MVAFAILLIYFHWVCSAKVAKTRSETNIVPRESFKPMGPNGTPIQKVGGISIIFQRFPRTIFWYELHFVVWIVLASVSCNLHDLFASLLVSF